MQSGRWTTEEAEQALGTWAAKGRPETERIEGKAQDSGKDRTIREIVGRYMRWRAQSVSEDSSKESLVTHTRRLVGRTGHPTPLGEVLASQFSRETVEHWYHLQVSEGRGPGSDKPTGRSARQVAKDVRYLMGAWRWAMPALHTHGDFKPRIPKGDRRNEAEKHNHSRAELARIFAWMERYEDREPQDVLWVMLGTGARPGEIMALRPADIFTDPPRLMLGNHKGERASKMGRTRIVHIESELLLRLRPYMLSPHADGRIWSRPNKTMQQTMRWRWAQAIEALGLPKTTIYALRRAADDAYYSQKGLTIDQLKDIAAQLDQSPKTALETYIRRATPEGKARVLRGAGLTSLPTVSLEEDAG